ncbi:MAG: coproporphyrinogen III oxidase family protein [Acidobacteria bacterium]|nr:coproporphyrinogen III oxidase family protein [Acidobacteriota bacterium]MYG75904.1 coproporphyrinogen III oxidase family protein [Acidobacteriota bacterium]
MTERATESDLGNVFVSNYPPYSRWEPGQVPALHEVLGAAPGPEPPDLGLYLHIPFCRKRCKFCYFRVYTDKNSKEVERYLDGLAREIEFYAAQPYLAGRPLHFVYFGGGTPSFISPKQLLGLVVRMKDAFSWSELDEVAFECEPGTLTEAKVHAIKDIGVTRLSLGLEHMNDAILRENGRAHTTKEIYRCMPWIREAAFQQVNVDLIAGMLGETWDLWRDTVQQTIDLDPDSVTVYQMELPYNTVYAKKILDGDSDAPLFASWQTRRDWHAYAFEEFAKAGFEPSSAYTVKKKGRGARFTYRDALWRGADMMATGVSSFGHLRGVHYQNTSSWDTYLEALEAGSFPIDRALETSPKERLIRETILQLKLGHLDPSYFRGKFGVELTDEFGSAFSKLERERMATVESDTIRLTPQGLLQVDSLLPAFYEPENRGVAYV